jgi:hypothetical protein
MDIPQPRHIGHNLDGRPHGNPPNLSSIERCGRERTPSMRSGMKCFMGWGRGEPWAADQGFVRARPRPLLAESKSVIAKLQPRNRPLGTAPRFPPGLTTKAFGTMLEPHLLRPRHPHTPRTRGRGVRSDRACQLQRRGCPRGWGGEGGRRLEAKAMTGSCFGACGFCLTGRTGCEMRSLMCRPNGVEMPRVRYGDEGEDWGATERPCHDCAAIKGEYHVLERDVARCPACGGQLWFGWDVSCQTKRRRP